MKKERKNEPEKIKKLKTGVLQVKNIKISTSGRLKKIMTGGPVVSNARKPKKTAADPTVTDTAPLMVSVSGIRGVIGKGFFPEVITRYASAFGTWSNAGKIVIGRDSRVSGEMVRTSVIAGLMATGCKIIDVGIVPTPTVEIAVRDLKAHGGIAITASHNPVEWNALKLIGPNGMFLTEPQARDVYELISENMIHYVGWDRLGKVEYYDYAIQNHIGHILELDYLDSERIRERRFRVAVDCINGAGGLIVPRLLRELNCEVITVNEQPHGIFPRNPEPSAENLHTLQEAVLENKADVGFAVDPDVDRLAIVSEKGIPLGEEYTLALAADYVLSKNPGPVVVNASTSSVIDLIAEKYGSQVYRTKIGEIHVSTKMKDIHAVIGGEGNGGIILPELHLGRDAVTGIVLTLQSLVSAQKPVSVLKADLPEFNMIKSKIDVKGIDTEKIIQKIKKDFKKQHIDETDGIKINFGRSWVQIRKSNTEPIIRVIAEALNELEAKKLISLFTSYFDK